MNKCINIKQKLDRTLYCKKLKKSITLKECSNCKYKEYKGFPNQIRKSTKINDFSSSDKPKMKSKSNKLAKAEKNRFSILTNDLEHCIICGKSPVNKHEIFYGSKHRQLSIKYGLVIPLCTAEHHNQYKSKGIHFDKELDLLYKKRGQQAFIDCYPDLDFVEIFKKNYL